MSTTRNLKHGSLVLTSVVSSLLAVLVFYLARGDGATSFNIFEMMAAVCLVCFSGYYYFSSFFTGQIRGVNGLVSNRDNKIEFKINQYLYGFFLWLIVVSIVFNTFVE